MENDDNTFHIGLCMAGAISAGAYTAGVLDYLIEALEDWETRRGQAGVPSHRVMISVIGGASAGGMTGILAAAAINNPIYPVYIDKADILSEQPQNPFYHSWVDLTNKNMFPLMLDKSDIRNKKIYSLLNSSFIDDITKKSIKANPDDWISRNYIRKNLNVFATLTNLEGFCAGLPFRSDGGYNNYLVKTHNDYGCFILNPDTKDIPPGWIPLDFRDGTNLDIARQVAMATGAFPVGLRARKVSRPKKSINELEWLKDNIDASTIINEPYNTLNVDGGLINNEPFERVRQLLIGITGQQKIAEEINNYKLFKSTVLMIDPFPSELENFEAEDDLFKVMGSTFSSMLGQLRSKPEVIREALASDLAGQYLIAPVRYIKDVRKEGRKAIACGSFGGFGGFLHKEFRIHDYFLGRDNCEVFLRDHFTIPIKAGNSIFEEGYRNSKKASFTSEKDNGLQIIPIFKIRHNPISRIDFFSSGGDWPLRNEYELDEFSKPLRQRVHAILMNLDDYKWRSRVLIWIGARVFLNSKLANLILNSIKTSLKDFKLLK